MRLGLLVSLALLAGCITTPTPEPSTPAPTGGMGQMALASPSFEDGGPIPRENTCDGEELSPPLAIANAPANATHLALLMHDPDVPIPEAPVRDLTHWTLWNVPLVNGSVAFAQGAVPMGSVEGANDGGGNGYLGPCPPQGSNAHHYHFVAWALDAPLSLTAGATRAQVETAAQEHALAEASLVGLYTRAIM